MSHRSAIEPKKLHKFTAPAAAALIETIFLMVVCNVILFIYLVFFKSHHERNISKWHLNIFQVRWKRLKNFEFPNAKML